MHISFGLLLSLLCITNEFSSAASRAIGIRRGDRIFSDRIAVSEDEILDAKALLVSIGVPERNLCLDKEAMNREDDGTYDDGDGNKHHLALPLCDPSLPLGPEIEETTGVFEAFEEHRFLEVEEEKPAFEEDPMFVVAMASCAIFCVVLAALAAGLTMGMLSLDPLMLLVKIRASRSPDEKRQAESLLPIVKQHHLLLVTLLLLNSLANEALPLFLEKLLSPVASVLLSVSFVLM